MSETLPNISIVLTAKKPGFTIATESSICASCVWLKQATIPLKNYLKDKDIEPGEVIYICTPSNKTHAQIVGELEATTPNSEQTIFPLISGKFDCEYRIEQIRQELKEHIAQQSIETQNN